MPLVAGKSHAAISQNIATEKHAHPSMSNAQAAAIAYAKARGDSNDLIAKLDAIIAAAKARSDEVEIYRIDADFKESDHPRDSDGKFGSGGGKASSKARLTPTEKTYLASYSGDDFLRVNKALRAGKDAGPAAQKLESAIAKSTVPKGTKLYRGLSKEGLKSVIGGDEIKVGQVISDKGFLSTSKDEAIAGMNSIGGVKMIINVGDDQHGLDLDGISDNDHEKEVLLPKNAKLKITNIRAPKGVGQPIIVVVETVQDESRQDSAENSNNIKMSKQSDIIRAAGVIFVSGDKALFLQRSAEGDHPGEWAFVGGKIEDGESAEESARRECREEIGQMPKGTMAIHCRRISTVIPQPASIDLLAPPVETEPQVDFTTFVMRVKDEFEPTLNEEHQGWAWAPISAPPQPMHPGAAAAIAKFTMNEYDIAVEIKDGRLTSPQQHMGNTWLFDMRITGTGMSFRTKHKEFVMRDPALYLNDYFLARCAGLEVIVEHPPDATLDTDEYRERIVGSIILPYIKGDEVWGIAKIRDAACAMMLTDPDRKDEYSTSPAVVFRKSDGNTAHIIDGQKILVEGPPSSLDHLAICRVGVWDKGGEPNGIVSTRGDSDVAKADEDMMSMMDAFRADMAKFADSMKDCSAKMDSATKRMDEEEEKKKADAAKRADAEKEEEKKKADAAKAKADANENGDDEDKKKADAKAKADAEEEDKKKADAAKKADAEKDEMDKKDDAARADALVANHPDFKAMREQLAALSAKMPAVISDADRGAFADAQARADVAYKAHGKDAPGPLMGETILSYRKRLAAGQKANSPRAEKLDVLSIADEGFMGVMEEMIYADSVAASRSTAGIPVGQLRERRSTSAAGHKIAEFDGDPGVWMSQFMGNTKATSTHSIRSRDPGRFN